MVKQYLKELKIKYIKTNETEDNLLRRQIRTSKDAYNLFKFLQDSDKEKVLVAYLGLNCIINCYEILHIGSVTFSLIDPKQVFKGALLTNSMSFIILHNHPSGNALPSKTDAQMIETLEKQSKIMNIDFVDCIIIGDDQYWSLEDGLQKI